MSITYDEMGNPLSDGTRSYAWEHGRQLAAMSNGTTTWTYTYDANGMRTSRSNGSTTYSYVYNGSKLMQMTVGSYKLTFTYDGSGNPSTVTFNGTTYYYITNLQGDVIEIRTASGGLICEYSYDAWGNIVSSTSSTNAIASLNPLLYRGYVYDRDTGLYYLQSRYYNPAIGRFINADALVSTGQGVLGNNMFTYCLNSPLRNADSGGNEAYDLFDSIDEAALDFAMCYNAESIEAKQEYGAAIFRITYSEIRTSIKSFTLSLFGKKITIRYYVTEEVWVTKYYYNKPTVGKEGNTVTPNFIGVGTIVSTIHTHANYDPRYDNDHFSRGLWSDIFYADIFKMDIYVATPIGKLLKYTYSERNNSSGGVSVISSDIPWDANHPGR